MGVLVWFGNGEGSPLFFSCRPRCLWNAHGLGFAHLWHFWVRTKVQLHFQPKMGEEWGSQNILLDTHSQLGLWSVWRIPCPPSTWQNMLTQKNV